MDAYEDLGVCDRCGRDPVPVLIIGSAAYCRYCASEVYIATQAFLGIKRQSIGWVARLVGMARKW